MKNATKKMRKHIKKTIRANTKIKKLNSIHHKRGNNNDKYYIDCSINYDKFIATKILDNTEMRILFYGLLQEHNINEKIVAKIMKRTKKNTNRIEYNYGKLLENIEGFIRFICLLECKTNIHKIHNKTEETEEIEEKSICINTGGIQKEILISPYYEVGSMENFYWNETNIPIFKSCLKQIILSFYYAYKMHRFIHNDFHYGNVLLEETNENEIRYEYIIVETNGYKTVIMDFDNSYIDADVRYFWEEIMDVFEKITLYINIVFIQKPLYDIKQLLYSLYKENNNNIDKCFEIVGMIDLLELDFIKQRKIH